MIWFVGIFGALAAGSFLLSNDVANDPDGKESSGKNDTTEAGTTTTSLDTFLEASDESDTAVQAPPPLTSTTSSDTADFLSGTQNPDEIHGQGGNDQINGYDGADMLFGDAGNDQLYGGTGADTLYGGDGNDTLHGEDAADHLSGGDGDDAVFGHFGDDTLLGGTGADSLQGGQGNDSLDGGDGADSVHGYDGDDTVVGGSGADALFGGMGNDTVSGADDTVGDYVNGGGGDDMLVAGLYDTLTGGEGLDQILIGDWLEGGTIDIADFTAGEDQLILIYDTVAHMPELSLETRGEYIAVLLDGVETLRITGAGQLSLNDVHLLKADAQQLPAILGLPEGHTDTIG